MNTNILDEYGIWSDAEGQWASLGLHFTEAEANRHLKESVLIVHPAHVTKVCPQHYQWDPEPQPADACAKCGKGTQ